MNKQYEVSFLPLYQESEKNIIDWNDCNVAYTKFT